MTERRSVLVNYEVLRSNGTECSVGIEEYGQHNGMSCPVRVLQCGHMFNEPCYQEWKTSDANRHNTCPICRNELSPPQPPPETLTPLVSQESIGDSQEDNIGESHDVVFRLQQDEEDEEQDETDEEVDEVSDGDSQDVYDTD